MIDYIDGQFWYDGQWVPMEYARTMWKNGTPATPAAENALYSTF